MMTDQMREKCRLFVKKNSYSLLHQASNFNVSFQKRSSITCLKYFLLDGKTLQKVVVQSFGVNVQDWCVQKLDKVRVAEY